MFVAKEIQWDFDRDEVLDKIDSTSAEEASKITGLTVTEYESLTREDRRDVLYHKLRHCPALLDEFMGLPDEIEIPEELTEPEDISEWLSYEYGFCHEGFELKEVSVNNPTHAVTASSYGWGL